MKPSTRKLIGRLRQLIKEAAEGARRTKAWQRTPWQQRPPRAPEPDWSARSHILCALRAEMRGRTHQQGWTREHQREQIEKVLESASKWEALLKEPRVHLTFPNWLRCTIRDAVKAGEEERKLRTTKQERRERYKAAS